jgi:XTP/dITP diphosphohydrolase
LGDLLLHIVFYAKIGSETGRFDMADVANGVSDKLVYRHPHVFSDIHANTPGQVAQNWEQLKTREKNRKQGLLSGVPQSLPAMVKAWRIGQKAASAGFDWERKEDVWEKVREELGEVEAEMKSATNGQGNDELNPELDSGTNYEELQEEFGDLFFSLINAARLYGVDPELALERCNRKFIRRFNCMEEKVTAQGKQLRDLPLEQLEAYWQEAKEEENSL